MRAIGCVNCEIFLCDFMAQTCALIAPLQPVLHRVLSINETLPSAPKHYETHQNMSLWSYGVDRVCLLREILKRLGGTNFCINCTSSAHFAPSFVQQRNDPKSPRHFENAPKHEFRVRWCGTGRFVAKTSNGTLWHELLH